MTKRSSRRHSYKYWTTRMTSLTVYFAPQTPAIRVNATTGDGLFSLVGREEEIHSWITYGNIKNCVSITRARLGKLEKMFENSRLRLFALMAFLAFLNFHSRLYKSIETQKVCCTYKYICDIQHILLTTVFREIEQDITSGNKNTRSKHERGKYIKHTKKTRY